ncbi:MAG: DUF2752 domain-containing protein [Candidatus Eiseniibacteriota bacterium]
MLTAGGQGSGRRTPASRLTGSEQLVVLLGLITVLILGVVGLGVTLWPELPTLVMETEAGAEMESAEGVEGAAAGAEGAVTRSADGIVTELARGLLERYACPLRHATGIACPTCGGTRAMMALAGGHPLRAFVWNPIVTLAALGLPLLGLLTVMRPPVARRGGAVLRRLLGAWWGRALLVIGLLAQIIHLTVMLR